MKVVLVALFVMAVLFSGCIDKGKTNKIVTEIDNVDVFVEAFVQEINQTDVDRFGEYGRIRLDDEGKFWANPGEKIVSVIIGLRLNRTEEEYSKSIDKHYNIEFEGESSEENLWALYDNGEKAKSAGFSRVAEKRVVPLTVEVDGTEKVFQVNLENGNIKEV
jgi:hypothetical protein